MRMFALGAIAALLISFQPAEATVVANVSLSSQTMTVTENGTVLYQWKVSTGRKGFVTPKGKWTAKWLSKNHRSRKYNNAPMPFAVFYNGGYAVHATYETKRLGRPASHGCIRLHPENAAAFYALTHRYGLANTRINISH
ncbi:L,D-transpeptidase family protein [Rhizobiales bacterium RZME27]|uniref:L,D-transpeptidase family protein n=1 Tax=Endobacterium cereale TaxID=2663029 RepID=A0A6A8AF75_9HYPH|nr:L,D-transpeptidase [Endobacterium cereale]MEB2845855.1 L,D-transpeptidase [Endobacterium cereale]MQY49975.1 L,D-transpeptidase family protein [Endobacterium cereale]